MAADLSYLGYNIDTIAEMLSRENINYLYPSGETILFKSIDNNKTYNSRDIPTELDLGIDLNIKNYRGYTAYFHALIQKKGDLLPNVRFTEKSDIDMKTEDGTDALMWAVINNDLGLFNHLLKLGFDPFYRRHNGDTVIDIAKREKDLNPELLKIINKMLVGVLLDSDITTYKGDMLHGDIINYEIYEYL